MSVKGLFKVALMWTNTKAYMNCARNHKSILNCESMHYCTHQYLYVLIIVVLCHGDWRATALETVMHLNKARVGERGREVCAPF